MAVLRDRYVLDIDTKGALNGLNSLKGAVAGFISVLAVREVFQFGNSLLEVTKQFQTYENQLRLVTANSEDLKNTFESLSFAARANRQSIGDTVDLYSKLSLATEQLGKSQEDVVAVTSQFQRALAISGADANTASGAIRQFGQAMASGTVRGDEFVSIVEALGPALAIMARESGLTVGELRKLSQAGDLTANVFFDLFKNSQELQKIFSSLDTTTEQLQVSLGDSFGRFVVSLDNATGASDKFNTILRNLIRTLDQMSGVDPFENFVDLEIFNQAEQGILRIDDALFELQKRREESINPFRGTFGNQEEVDAISALIEKLEQLKETRQEQFEQAQKDINQQKEFERGVNALLEPLSEYNGLLQEYADIDIRTELEKATEAQLQAQEVLTELVRLQSEINTETEIGKEAYSRLSTQIEDTQRALKSYGDTIDEINEKTAENNFDQYLQDLIETAEETAQTQQFAKDAVGALKEQLDAGSISAEVYNTAMKRISGSTRSTVDETKKLKDSIKEVIEATELRTQAARDDAVLDNLSGIERTLKEIEIAELRTAEAAKKRVLAQAQEAGIDSTAIQGDIARIDAATQAAIQSQQDIATAQYEAQRSFNSGWSKAFEEYVDEATNASATAERLFAKMSRGIEDSFVSFAKTGKFEVKDLLATIAEEILRSGIRRLVAQLFGSSLFGGGGGGGGLGFAGGFADGGRIPSGQFGLVGERGPELISGPATITPLNNMGGGATSVNYNINAVDASSFKSLIARDPAFIYAVTEKGRRSVPQTRR